MEKTMGESVNEMVDLEAKLYDIRRDIERRIMSDMDRYREFVSIDWTKLRQMSRRNRI